MSATVTRPRIAIACGGTGGHLFPGIAVGEVLAAHGCSVTLLVSSKEIDRRGTNLAPQFECVILPAIGWERGRSLQFLRSGMRSYTQARAEFRARRPAAVLAMGGFTSAPPILAGRKLGTPTFIHESNSIPGRANRWLAGRVDRVFVGFPQTAARLRCRGIRVTGTPVRARFGVTDQRECRLKIGLDPDDPVLLVMGGSQGASAINEGVIVALPALQQQLPRLQIIHLTGPRDHHRTKQAYSVWHGKALVKDFAGEMESLMGAATVAITRAGASTLAELAASGLASVLVPYPRAADNHQYFNARALADTGAARILEETSASPAAVVSAVRGLVVGVEERRTIQEALKRWHRAEAAVQIASEILASIGVGLMRELEGASPPASTSGNGGLDVAGSGMAGRALQESWHG